MTGVHQGQPRLPGGQPFVVLHLAGAPAVRHLLHLRELRPDYGRLRTRLAQRHPREEYTRRLRALPRRVQGRIQTGFPGYEHDPRRRRVQAAADDSAARRRGLHRLDVQKQGALLRLAAHVRDPLHHRRRRVQPFALRDARSGLPERHRQTDEVSALTASRMRRAISSPPRGCSTPSRNGTMWPCR